MEIKQCLKSDFDYPNSLRQYTKSPEKIYYMGDISLCNNTIIGVIGKRDSMVQAFKVAKSVGEHLAQMDITVLNGMARGCDTFAMTGYLEKGGKPICVMPCGLDIPYPLSNKLLIEKVVSNGGCVISEYPVGTNPQKHQFLQRDKLQAMLLSKLIVVDSDKSGGTFFTAETAIKYGKSIACCMYPEMAEGNSFFVKQKDAFPILSCEDIDSFVKKVDYEQLVLNFA